MKKLILKRFVVTTVLLSISFFSLAKKDISPWQGVHASDTKQVKDIVCDVSKIAEPSLKIEHGMYQDRSGSIVDVEKYKDIQKKTKKFEDIAEEITKLADLYIQTKNSAYAQCATTQLASLAKQDVMRKNVYGFQAKYFQTWMLCSFSLSWLKMKDNPQISSNERDIINMWLSDISKQVKAYFKNKVNRSDSSNLSYWAALGVMSAAIVNNNEQDYQWSVSVFKHAMRHLTKDGYLPNELKRKTKALHYHIFALEPLVTIAELARVNGDNLYAYNHAALGRLINATLLGVNNPQKINKIADVRSQKFGRGPYLEFLSPYLTRKNDTKNIALLKKYKQKTHTYLGGAPFPP